MGMERTEAQTERWDLNSSLFIHTGCTICTGGGGGGGHTRVLRVHRVWKTQSLHTRSAPPPHNHTQ